MSHSLGKRAQGSYAVIWHSWLIKSLKDNLETIWNKLLEFVKAFGMTQSMKFVEGKPAT